MRSRMPHQQRLRDIIGWQIGDGTTFNRTTPTGVSGLGSGVAALAAGTYHSCALTTDGAVWCWGANTSGQLGDGTNTNSNVPVAVTGLGSGVAAIAAGQEHSCALSGTGAVSCWGRNTYAELGDGTLTSSNVPVAVSGLASGVEVLTAGRYHNCVVTTGGAALCWGQNTYGQIGDGTFSTGLVPVAVSGLGSAVDAVEAGGQHTCAVTASGAALCWGDNGDGQLGDGTTETSGVPVPVSGLASGIASISAGGSHSCALTTGGAAFCWGYDLNGQLGDDHHGLEPEAVAVTGFGAVTVPALGALFLAALAVALGRTARKVLR